MQANMCSRLLPSNIVGTRTSKFIAIEGMTRVSLGLARPSDVAVGLGVHRFASLDACRAWHVGDAHQRIAMRGFTHPSAVLATHARQLLGKHRQAVGMVSSALGRHQSC